MGLGEREGIAGRQVHLHLSLSFSALSNGGTPGGSQPQTHQSLQTWTVVNFLELVLAEAAWTARVTINDNFDPSHRFWTLKGMTRCEG